MPSTSLQSILDRGKLELTSAPILYRCEPIWSWRVDSLPGHAILLILDGRGKLTVDGTPIDLRQGLCFFLKPGAKIEAQQNPSYPLFLFLAQFENLNTVPKAQEEEEDINYESLFIHNARNLETLAELVASREPQDALFDDAIRMLIRLIVSEANHNAGNFDPNAYEALYAIENDLARKWTIADLAAEAKMSATSFARSFKRMTSEPPIHYVIRRRMEEAKRKIQQSSLPIEEIAINLGYDDFSFFRQLFQKRLGQTPESLRVGRTI
ncbi:helix-turn-helix domain-containing protein [Pelagicoccus mobilis]|uniref:Helix-turn-helix domain-containing protein n=1 Tax=Pelagicoccus mobilis TaxID=415221 RepID=A0A934VRG5_9BACT|nr:helix-turn-helix domain-containing protein [Pelagicoccus mobilis]MBK1877489.1 helix-turn-helix domain-containing protein [Pelagicoccus mobilis]